MTKPPNTDPVAATTLTAGTTVLDGTAPDADEPMTELQAARLRKLTEKLGEPMDGALTRGQAEARIAALKERT